MPDEPTEAEADRCGWCKLLLRPDGPSRYFCNEAHQRHWQAGDPPPQPVMPIVTDLSRTPIGDTSSPLAGAFNHVARAAAAAAHALAQFRGAA